MCIFTAVACGKAIRTDDALSGWTLIELDKGAMIETRSQDPQEDLVTDMNIFIFNDRGMLEEGIYLTAKQMDINGSIYSTHTRLLSGATYSVYALANAGYRINLETEQEVENFKYYLTYPDEYKTGIPMCGKAVSHTVQAGQPLKIKLERAMARISLRLDRSRLDKDVSFHVNSVDIGGCPKMVTPFKTSAVASDFDIFLKGFSKSGSQVAALNTDYGQGKSGEISVYMFENMQGDLLDSAETDSDKILEESDPKAKVCSYIEIRADYESDTHYTMTGDELVYRFYLGDNPRNFDVKRNTHYHITVTPDGRGLSENSWRVDQSGLSTYSPYYMKISPGTFIRGKIGESFHIRCDYYPRYAEFDIGLEELEYDRQRGIYDYTIDEDGDGVILMLKKRGSGMLYMETGYPINQSEIITVIVE